MNHLTQNNQYNNIMNEIKTVKSPNYNYIFNRANGSFARWGKYFNDDPEFSPFGPEILDIEVSTICHRACPFCYKSNTAIGKNMAFATFKEILDKMPDNLTQIAFGIGSIDANPDLLKMMEYSRSKGVIPNITINGDRLTDEHIEKLTHLCGAVAVSLYDEDTCYNTVKALSDKIGQPGTTLKQVNIHALLSHETITRCMTALSSKASDQRLKNLNAIVFLMLKPKGNRNTYTKVNHEEYETLVLLALQNKIPIGFDSCSAPSFLKVTEEMPEFEKFKMLAEPCESTLFSYYINVDGIGFPCSFTEGHQDYEGVDVLNAKEFMSDVWNHRETRKFRDNIIHNTDGNNCRNCFLYDLEVR